MGLTSDIKNITGVVTVQIEGFFTERFINLCKINNVKIWNVRNIVNGIIRFNINISNFKRLKNIARKTKCKVKIKEKKGLYFTIFKYRKRKLVTILVLLLILSCIFFSMFIWNIEIIGNKYISKEQIIKNLNDSGLYVGKSKIGLDKKDIINTLRVNLEDLSWIGIDILGTTANIKVIEKTKLDEKNIQHNLPGDIVTDKSGIITKIVPENGTAMYKLGSYIEAGNVVIEGTMYSKFIEPQRVPAKGIVRIKSEYEFKKEYKYSEVVKKYTNKQLYTVGISINSKENMLNYLNNSKKYDITKNSKEFSLFNNKISFDIYKCLEYVEVIEENTKEELITKANYESEKYLQESLLNILISPNVIDKVCLVEDTIDGVIVTFKYNIEEQVGKFIERN